MDEFQIPDDQGWMLFQWPATDNETNYGYRDRYYQAWLATSHRPGPGPFDVNGDGELNGSDTDRLLTCLYNSFPSVGCSPSDIDGSCTVDAVGLALLLARGLDEPAATTHAGTLMANFNCGD